MKLIQLHTEFILPNVSLCGDAPTTVYYSPNTSEELRLIAKYNVVNSSTPTKMYYYEKSVARGVDIYDKIEIDGEEVSIASIDASGGTYQLNVGEHTVAYTLKDPTLIGTIRDGDKLKVGAIFTNVSTLTTIEIPNSVTTIGNAVFRDCSSLTSCTIGSGATSIGNNVFEECSNLTFVKIGSGVTSIGEAAFNQCSSLASIIIPNSVASIGEGAFYRCSGLVSVTIGSGVTRISESTFRGCTSITSIEIPNSVTNIGDSAFYGCTSLTSCAIGSSVARIGYNAFGYCTSLTSITSLATTAPTIQSTTFQKVKTNGTLYVPSGSSGYDTWMQNANYYLGLYNWTKVEQ